MRHRFYLHCKICGHSDGPYAYAIASAGLIEHERWGHTQGGILCPECYQRNKYDKDISPLDGVDVLVRMVKELSAIVEGYEDLAETVEAVTGVKEDEL